MTVREAALSLWDTVQMAKVAAERVGRGWRELPTICAYAVEYPSRRRRTPMDVKAMVKAWVPVIRGLATAHDKAELDRCEFEMERHMTPLLAAPVKQIREFYARLCAALEADPETPFFVWATFRAYHEVVVKKAADGEVVELKKALATEIADLVEEDVRPDVGRAIAAALQWRPAEKLERVRDAVRAGAKPRLVGRESCLFLSVPEADGSETLVML